MMLPLRKGLAMVEKHFWACKECGLWELDKTQMSFSGNCEKCLKQNVDVRAIKIDSFGISNPIEENPWIDCEKELPPCDGEYEALLECFTQLDVFYNGYYFTHGIEGRIDDITHWRHITKKEKRYGKVKDE